MARTPSNPGPEEAEDDSCGNARDGAGLMESLCAVGEFVRALRVKLRFGELTRAPLRLLRLEVTETDVKCALLARHADRWDAGLSGKVRQRNEAQQALQDAIQVRALLFRTLPGLDRGEMRFYRETQSGRELIAAGRVERGDRVARNVRSLAMRAKLLGFQFNFEDEVLLRMAPEPYKGGGWSSVA